MSTPSPTLYTRTMRLPIPLPADVDELEDCLPDPTPEQIEGLLEARAALARDEGLPLEEVEARTARFLRNRARARRAEVKSPRGRLCTMTQREHRRKIEVGPVMDWYQAGHFASNEEARGAFKLAYQQGLDGMGRSIAEWMGMTADQFDDWMRGNGLPSRR